jgi:hypothetical protein
MIPLVGMLANAGMNLLGNFISIGKDKAIKAIKDKTGIDLSTKKELSPEEVQKLKEFEVKNKELILQKTQMYLQDTQNARETFVSLNTSAKTPIFNKVFPNILAGVTVILTFILFYLFTQGNFEGAKKDIVVYILGVLSTITTQIFAYYFGSSMGSKEKTQALVKGLK